MLSGMNAVSQWADIIPAPIKAAAIEALKKAPEHPAVEVRRATGGALGKLGVKGLSARLAGMLRKDPEGAISISKRWARRRTWRRSGDWEPPKPAPLWRIT
ncbi:MAG: hypothetical protein QOD99_1416 [Chthoniobacter sp.]|jgi:hypothetical protein|nr:hypothetical protein [Chthoniobacter sp.]